MEKNLQQKKMYLIKNCKLLIPRPPQRTSKLQETHAFRPQKRTSSTSKQEISYKISVYNSVSGPRTQFLENPYLIMKRHTGVLLQTATSSFKKILVAFSD
jgi:hypothetical protein